MGRSCSSCCRSTEGEESDWNEDAIRTITKRIETYKIECNLMPGLIINGMICRIRNLLVISRAKSWLQNQMEVVNENWQKLGQGGSCSKDIEIPSPLDFSEYRKLDAVSRKRLCRWYRSLKLTTDEIKRLQYYKRSRCFISRGSSFNELLWKRDAVIGRKRTILCELRACRQEANRISRFCGVEDPYTQVYGERWMKLAIREANRQWCRIYRENDETTDHHQYMLHLPSVDVFWKSLDPASQEDIAMWIKRVHFVNKELLKCKRFMDSMSLMDRLKSFCGYPPAKRDFPEPINLKAYKIL